MAMLIPLFLASALALLQCAAAVPIGNVNALDMPAYQVLSKVARRCQFTLSLFLSLSSLCSSLVFCFVVGNFLE